MLHLSAATHSNNMSPATDSPHMSLPPWAPNSFSSSDLDIQGIVVSPFLLLLSTGLCHGVETTSPISPGSSQ